MYEFNFLESTIFIVTAIYISIYDVIYKKIPLEGIILLLFFSKKNGYIYESCLESAAFLFLTFLAQKITKSYMGLGDYFLFFTYSLIVPYESITTFYTFSGLFQIVFSLILLGIKFTKNKPKNIRNFILFTNYKNYIYEHRKLRFSMAPAISLSALIVRLL
ncbi:hypothetical protein [Candidatus Nesciobacter abundans]|uniref:Uncharacterized protein n=1 Tax=Candidatus Nesciobacter abundans TaxID=2601668 RepID=A0A5C0UG53_9PROT|nr:hypothetical protein [Candidatus Nesciobacter abundans]QEK39038.1 hypothetical protein FZC36_01135 [Candidatus Nesciobacter abundans]